MYYPKYLDTLVIQILQFEAIQLTPWLCIHSQTSIARTDGSFTMANSNSFLSPYKILPISQVNKYFGKFSYFIMKLYDVCTH